MNIFQKFLNLIGLYEHEWYDGPDQYKGLMEDAFNRAIVLLWERDGVKVSMKWDKWKVKLRDDRQIVGYVQGDRPWYRSNHFPGKRVLAHLNLPYIYVPKGFWFDSLIHEAIHFLCEKNGVLVTESRNHTLNALKVLK